MTAAANGPEPAAWTRAIRRSALQDLLVATARRDVISLALGLPAADLFPTQAMGAVITRILRDDPRALQYSPPSSQLRAFVAKLMGRRGVACEPEQVFLTAGAQQGMSLLTRLLLESGSTVMLEECCYTGFQQAVAPQDPRLVTVPTRLETGIDVDAVERSLEGGTRPALLYAMSDGHNPMGTSMPLAARKRLVALARSHRLPILEDDAYGLLSYDDQDLPALRALDPEWVFYLGSFSKTLAPALRTGWVVVPEQFIGPLASLKESSDIDTATLGQRAVAAFVSSGAFDDHLGRLRAEYARRRDAMLSALERAFGSQGRWSRPRAGFFTWVDLPEGVDTIRLFERALEHEHVAFVPGAAFTAGDAAPARSSLRLNYSFSAPEILQEGVARIARALEFLRRPCAATVHHA
jgi:2-aminoadipate transaminase